MNKILIVTVAMFLLIGITSTQQTFAGYNYSSECCKIMCSFGEQAGLLDCTANASGPITCNCTPKGSLCVFGLAASVSQAQIYVSGAINLCVSGHEYYHLDQFRYTSPNCFYCATYKTTNCKAIFSYNCCINEMECDAYSYEMDCLYARKSYLTSYGCSFATQNASDTYINGINRRMNAVGCAAWNNFKCPWAVAFKDYIQW